MKRVKGLQCVLSCPADNLRNDRVDFTYDVGQVKLWIKDLMVNHEILYDAKGCLLPYNKGQGCTYNQTDDDR